MTDAPSPRVQTRGEELVNTITHGLGAALGVAGLVLLVVYASIAGDPWAIVASAIYGASVVVLFGASAVYHWLEGARAKRIFQILDHAAIFLLIAGTYTPFTLVALRGPWGWSLFGVVWGIAVVGVVIESVWIGRFPRLSVALYLAMGWVGIVAAVPLWNALPTSVLALLVAGGLAYTAGVAFFVWESLPFHHAYWHLFVLAGAGCHFAAVWSALL